MVPWTTRVVASRVTAVSVFFLVFEQVLAFTAIAINSWFFDKLSHIFSTSKCIFYLIRLREWRSVWYPRSASHAIDSLMMFEWNHRYGNCVMAKELMEFLSRHIGTTE